MVEKCRILGHVKVPDNAPCMSVVHQTSLLPGCWAGISSLDVSMHLVEAWLSNLFSDAAVFRPPQGLLHHQSLCHRFQNHRETWLGSSNHKHSTRRQNRPEKVFEERQVDCRNPWCVRSFSGSRQLPNDFCFSSSKTDKERPEVV
jgi:hypothetical protein